MRADGEITKDEYQVMRTPIDTEIQELQKVLENIPTDNDNLKGFDLDSIISTLNSLVDFSGSTISHDVINQFVYLVTPTSDTTFEWYVNLNGKPNVKATFTAEGRKKNCLIRLEEIERISSLHRKENESNAQLIKNPCLLTYLHRLLLLIGINQKIAIQWDFPITFEMARAYQKANGKYLRQNQWEDITLVMSLELGR